MAFVSAAQPIVEQLPFVYEATLEGVADTLKQTQTGPTVVQAVGHSWDNGPYGSVAWFSDQARYRITEGGKIREPQILWEPLRDALQRDPTRDTIPHIGHMTLLEDMTAEIEPGVYANFVWGYADGYSHQSVTSIGRLIASRLPLDELILVSKHAVRHEVGHSVGLNGATITNSNTAEGLENGHCTNVCTMKQTMSIEGTVALARALQNKPHAGFCGDCVTYLGNR